MERTATQPTPTANQLSCRAIGALFFTGFGVLWLTLAIYIRQMFSMALGLGIAAVFVALLLAALWLMREAKRFPRLPEDKAVSRSFNRINAAQWIAVAIIGFSFGRLHMEAYVLSAIAAVVGIHMFPLARLFRYPMHNVTGAALVAWASASVLLVPAEQLQGITALGTGIILWLSAAVTLVLGVGIARRANSTPGPAGNILCV